MNPLLELISNYGNFLLVLVTILVSKMFVLSWVLLQVGGLGCLYLYVRRYSFRSIPPCLFPAKNPKVDHRIANAFSTHPKDFPEVDWVFSDVICAPDKLFSWFEPGLMTKSRVTSVSQLSSRVMRTRSISTGLSVPVLILSTFITTNMKLRFFVWPTGHFLKTSR